MPSTKHSSFCFPLKCRSLGLGPRHALSDHTEHAPGSLARLVGWDGGYPQRNSGGGTLILHSRSLRITVPAESRAGTHCLCSLPSRGTGSLQVCSVLSSPPTNWHLLPLLFFLIRYTPTSYVNRSLAQHHAFGWPPPPASNSGSRGPTSQFRGDLSEAGLTNGENWPACKVSL